MPKLKRVKVTELHAKQWFRDGGKAYRVISHTQPYRSEGTTYVELRLRPMGAVDETRDQSVTYLADTVVELI